MEQTQAVYETVEAPPEPLDATVAEGTAGLPAPDIQTNGGAAAPRTKKKLRPSIPRVRLHTFDSFRYGNFRMLWGMTFSASAGWGIQEVVLGWLTYDLTRSPLLTSLALGLGAVPFLLAGPLGGVLVDSWDRRRMLAAAMVDQALITVGFALVVIFERVEAWNILSFSFLMGLPVGRRRAHAHVARRTFRSEGGAGKRLRPQRDGLQRDPACGAGRGRG